MYWEDRVPARATTRTTSNASISHFDISLDSLSGFSNSNTSFAQWDGLPSQVSPSYDTPRTGLLESRRLANDMAIMLAGFDEPSMHTVASLNRGATPLDYQELSSRLSPREEASQGQNDNRQAFHQTFIPIELPFLIAGVDTAIQQNLFCHFVNTTSQFLTTLSGQSNPFNQVVIPMALNDQTLMNTLLCLAGSHRLKVQRTTTNTELATERHRLHENAVRTQAIRVSDLKRGSESSIVTLQYRESVLATSLLLCLFEICEGTGSSSGKAHLETAREIITMASTPSISTSTSLTTDINPFLLEFFLYHDSLATVTSPSPILKPQFHSLSSVPDHDTSLVGVQDGLIDFITQISVLRAEADLKGLQRPDGDIICRAVQIWQDLSSWTPRFATSTSTPLSKPRQLITNFYQWALFIWLFSIVNPSSQSDPKVQTAVKKIIEGMGEISEDDGVMACLLFPLFVVGSAAIEEGDREGVLGLFRRLREWSGLGNIDLSERVVRGMWGEHDRGVEGSWDWGRQLEGVSLLVT